jgi:serine/threonine protein kinase
MKSCIKCRTTHARGLFCDHGHVLSDPENDDTLLGRVLDERYEVRSALGGGGFGMVYLGAQLRLEDRPCVIKVARPELAQDVQFAARFQREKKALMALRSRNTVQILDYGRTDDAIDYIVMEFIEGDELGQLLRRKGPMDPQRVIALARGICNSLIEAHGAGILHRDLKPGNVMLVDLGTSELVKVIDFGIARLAGGNSDTDFRTATGELPGTPAYAPYEQLIGQSEKVDERADVYSFGAILYEALTGVVPYGDRIRNRDFDSNTLYFLAIAQAKAGETPTLPSTLAMAPIPPLFEQLVVSMLHKTREERPATAQEVLDILQRIERIGATGTGTIEVDETIVAPLSELSSAVMDTQNSANTQFADSDTLDSVPEELRAAVTAEPEPSPAPSTVEPLVDVITRPPGGLSKGLLWGGGATIAALLVTVGFLIFGMGEKPADLASPGSVGKGSEKPVSANPAGFSADAGDHSAPAEVVSGAADVVSSVDIRLHDMKQPPKDIDMVDEPAASDLVAAPAADALVSPELTPQSDLVTTDKLASGQDATSPVSEDTALPAPTEKSEEQLREERRKREARRDKKKDQERFKKEQQRLKKVAEEGLKAESEAAKKAAEEASEAAAKAKSGEGGLKTIEEKAIEVKKEDAKTAAEEKKALHKRLDFMDDDEE